MRLIALLLAAVLAGCAGPQPGRLSISPIESRIDATAGMTLILPVQIAGRLDGREPIAARLDDGRALEASLYWISLLPDPAERPSWLPPAGRWFATPAWAGSLPSAAGTWVLAIGLPPDAQGGGLWLRDRRYSVHWLDTGATLAGALRAHGAVSADLLGPERASPVRRWRARLADGGAPGSGAIADPVLEALAAQTEARWSAGLAGLAREDAALAEELIGRLALIVNFGGTNAPAWPTSMADLDTLLADLLNPRLDAARRGQRIRAWLAGQPAARAWIEDDAGLLDQAGAPIATIGIANLSPAGALAGLSPLDAALPPDLAPLPPRTAAMFTLAADPASPGSPATIRATSGAWDQNMVIAAPAEVRPPGLRLGPLIPDWTMERWLSGEEPEADLGGAVLLLERSDTSAREPSAGRWTVYIEARHDPGAGGVDVFRLWIGPRGAPSAVLRVSSEGFVVDQAASGTPARDPARTTVARDGDRWMCRVAIPQRCVEADGTIRIGVERIDGRGRRSAWPRPMLPWQSEPGRLAVETGAWGALEAGQP